VESIFATDGRVRPSVSCHAEDRLQAPGVVALFADETRSFAAFPTAFPECRVKRISFDHRSGRFGLGVKLPGAACQVCRFELRLEKYVYWR
jgi:hypothetical protein